MELPDELMAGRIRSYGAYLHVAEVAYASIYGGQFLTVHSKAHRWKVADEVTEAVTADPLEWFESERANALIMVHRASQDKETSVCWDLTCTLSPLFPMRGHLDDWQGILGIALAATQSAGDDRGRAAVLYRNGFLHADLHELEPAAACFQQAALLFDKVGDIHGYAMATAYIAMVDRFQSELDPALRRYTEALKGLSAVNDRGGQGFTLRGIGQVYLDSGDLGGADEYFARALERYRGIGGARIGEAQVLFWQGMLRLQQERFDEADPAFREVFSISRALGDRPGQAQALRGLGLCYQKQGQQDQARTILLEALKLVRQPRPDLVEAHIRRTIADLDRDASRE